LQEAINLASLFVGQRTIAFQEDRSRRRAPIPGTSRSLSGLLPTVVLVDGATGWGAEIFAAALHDYSLATILGVRTSGKAGLATTLELPDGSIAQITSQRVVSPSGAALHRTGLLPDELVESQPAQWAQGQDPELEAALALLRR
jgi:carboxyl-terminal processing protease